MVELLIASGNAGKVREFQHLLGAVPGLVLRTLRDVAPMAAPDETGTRFEDNALIKARATAEHVDAAARGMLVLSDDSGLEVDALDGAPGVYSARYAGPDATDADNNAKLLAALADVAGPARSARYRVVLCLLDPGGPLGARPHYTPGVCEGLIRTAPAGSGGFGYDPLFQPQGYDCTMAELPAADKSAIDHRGRATRALLPFLQQYLAQRPPVR